jgi:hypothetical protein|tara:strand:- start:7155 stop:7547 length:393 start_codon:yes stop_codon:yes gene_type:complete
METTITKEITMSNEITINLEWETSENGMYFTTVFGTVKKTWEQIVGPIFGFEIKDNGWATGEQAQRFAETFAVKSYEVSHHQTRLTVNAKHMGSIKIIVEDGQVVVYASESCRSRQDAIATVSFNQIVGG